MNNSIHLLHSQTPIQMESFIITTADGKIIAIDGGHREDARYFVNYLKKLTGEERPRIDAWFLTHSHEDHVSAFFEVVQNMSDEVEIGKVYYNFPSVQFLLRGHDRNAAKTAEEFYSLLPLFANKACIVSGGDTYEIGEAKIEILYTTDPEITSNVTNNSSTVFKMTLGGKTALFLADCGAEAGNKILAKYAGTDMLDCDICQMAHHGQQGVTREFYEAVRPEICLWCTPKWLWENDAGKGFNTHVFKTVEVREWMEELGVKKNYIDMDGTQICPL